MSDKEISTLATALRDLAKLDVSSDPKDKARKEEYLRVAQRIDDLQILQKATIYYKRALYAWGSQHPDEQHAAKANDDQKVLATQKEFDAALAPFVEYALNTFLNKHTNLGGEYSIGGNVLPKEKT